jgi:uncharacterized protein YxeA
LLSWHKFRTLILSPPEIGERRMKRIILWILVILVLAFCAIWIQQWQKPDRNPVHIPNTSELTDAEKQQIKEREDYFRRSDEGLEHTEQQNR